MHKMQMYENLRDMLEREVKEITNKNELDAQGLDHLYKLMSALKNTNRCIEEESDGASYGYRSYDYGMSNNYSRIMPHSEMSYARRDGDGDGRYYESSRDNFRYSPHRGQSYENSYGYSRDNARQKLTQKLSTLMDDTMSEHERNAIMDCIDKIK